MTFRQKLRWYVGYHFDNWCPDPKCSGGMRIYDDRPGRDYCGVCRRTRTELAREPAVRQRRSWAEMSDIPFPEA